MTGAGSDPDRSNRCKAIAGDAGGLAVRGDRDGRGIPAALIAFPVAPVGGVPGYLIGARVLVLFAHPQRRPGCAEMSTRYSGAAQSAPV